MRKEGRTKGGKKCRKREGTRKEGWKQYIERNGTRKKRREAVEEEREGTRK